MFAHASSAFVLALPLFAAATVLPRTGGTDQCNTGSTYCCNSAVAPTDPTISTLLGLLGISVGSLTGLVGLTCSPLTIVGGGGTSCSAQPVCCTGNNYNGVVVVDCTPINLNV